MKQSSKSGLTLVEIMIAMLTLVVLVLGGAAVIYKSGGGIQQLQNKREAVVAANNALERFWNRTYDDLGDDAGKTISGTVAVNGISMPARIAVSSEQTDADGGRYYGIAVSVQYMNGETAIVQTRRYRRGLSKTAVNP